jgi:hypothetical protein
MGFLTVNSVKTQRIEHYSRSYVTGWKKDYADLTNLKAVLLDLNREFIKAVKLSNQLYPVSKDIVSNPCSDRALFNAATYFLTKMETPLRLEKYIKQIAGFLNTVDYRIQWINYSINKIPKILDQLNKPRLDRDFFRGGKSFLNEIEYLKNSSNLRSTLQDGEKVKTRLSRKISKLFDCGEQFKWQLQSAGVSYETKPAGRQFPPEEFFQHNFTSTKRPENAENTQEIQLLKQELEHIFSQCSLPQSELAKLESAIQLVNLSRTTYAYHDALDQLATVCKSVTRKASRALHPDKLGTSYNPDIHGVLYQRVNDLRNSIDESLLRWTSRVS